MPSCAQVSFSLHAENAHFGAGAEHSVVLPSGEQHALLALLRAAGPEAERTYGATVMGTPEYYNLTRKDYSDYCTL
jgi:hypothetical protein